MKQSEGLTKVLPSVLTIVFHGISFISLTVALKFLPISIVYAIWAGAGTAMVALIGWFVFNEPLPVSKVFATGLIIVGVVILNLSDANKKKVEQLAKAEKVEEKVSVPVEAATRNIATAQRNAG